MDVLTRLVLLEFPLWPGWEAIVNDYLLDSSGSPILDSLGDEVEPV